MITSSINRGQVLHFLSGVYTSPDGEKKKREDTACAHKMIRDEFSLPSTCPLP